MTFFSICIKSLHFKQTFETGFFCDTELTALYGFSNESAQQELITFRLFLWLKLCMGCQNREDSKGGGVTALTLSLLFVNVSLSICKQQACFRKKIQYFIKHVKRAQSSICWQELKVLFFFFFFFFYGIFSIYPTYRVNH